MVAAGRFWEDLYYRLQVVTIALPPLRERSEDIPLLVEHFVRRAAADASRPVTGVSQGALAALAAYPWPGNVRELSHVVERAVVLARHEVLTIDDFANLVAEPMPDDARAGGTPGFLERPTLREVTRRYVLSVLDENGGNVSRAATVLGIDGRSLHRMLKRYAVGTRA